jgi:regulator of cell morphogenesis and NO signaling
LYNGFFNIDIANFSKDDIVLIINYLKNCHNHYKYEKFTIIKQYIKELFQINNTKETLLIEKFFNEYYDEVIEHLDYEEQIAFPYIEHLVEDNKEEVQYNFSVEQYRNHHSDIEYKLKDLLKLLLMHITVNEDKIINI